MKNKITRIIVAIIIFLIVLFGLFLGIRKYNESNAAKLEVENSTTLPINNYLVNTNNNDNEDFKTKYADGRISSVRNFRYYNSLIKLSVPFGNTVAAKNLGLTTVTAEWDKYDGNVVSPESAFIEEEIFPSESRKKEFREAGVPEAEMNSTMVGGDVETNRRIKEPSIRYWAVASKMFEQEFKNLKKAEGISNRDIDSVTFDFITTSGFYTVQVQKTDLESGKSVWSTMFKESKFLNTEMARVQNETTIDARKRYEAR